MYEKLPESTGRALGFEVRGRIEGDELTAMLREMEEVVESEGEVRLLVYIAELPTTDFDAITEDLGFWLEHGDDIERYAVVGESTLLDWATDVGGRMTTVDVQYFAEEDMRDAWEWVNEDELPFA